MAEGAREMLTQRKVDRAKPGRYADDHGLYLIVHNARNKSFAYRWERNGRERWMGLGPCHTIDLKQARQKAREARLLLLEGVDPIEQRKAAKAAHALTVAKTKTFKECAEDYIAANRDGWRNAKHGQQWISTLKTYVHPVLGNLPVSAIDTGLVLKCIEPHWKTTTETMSRVRGRIEAVLDWATARGYRSGDNPAAWKTIGKVLPARAKIAKPIHHPALSYRELPTFMSELRQHKGVGARALEFLILTCARTGEVLGAQQGEIDLTHRVWIIPAGRMKAAKQHRVALSQRAIELLEELPTEEGNNFVFVGPHKGSGLSPSSLTQTLRRMRRRDLSVHGFRSSFRDWAAEQTNFPREVAELALAHRVGDKTEQAYQRADMLKKRHALAEAWSRYCSAPAAKADGKIVPMHGSAR
jgi:integrase